eukprot:15430377-Alexandrium_andersonii.AAC.1
MSCAEPQLLSPMISGDLGGSPELSGAPWSSRGLCSACSAPLGSFGFNSEAVSGAAQFKLRTPEATVHVREQRG